MPDLPFDITDRRLAAAAWTRIAEPADPVAGALVAALGPEGALDWLCHAARCGTVRLPGTGGPQGAAASAKRLQESVDRWTPRLDRLDIRRELGVLHARGGRLVTPEDDEWPEPLGDLAATAPAALWVRGAGRLDTMALAVAVVGARASTAYGEHLAAQLGIELAEHGVVVVSGGAYGIDAAAHRGTLSVEGVTAAVLAGGVDRLYPAGNATLLEAVLDRGVIMAEVPPGSVPSRHRFLDRNRLIAALSRACVVVEAGWRSGALSTARHAANLLRPVGAVPGPVTSMTSAGCHRLLRETDAVCITQSRDVLELVGPVGQHLPEEPAVQAGLLDELDPLCARLLDALPARSTAGTESLARAGGMSLGEVRSALGRLELAGRVQRQGNGWRRSPSPSADG